MSHNDHPFSSSSGSPPSSAAPATVTALRDNELTKLHQSMLQREALGAIKLAGISHGGVDGEAADQIYHGQEGGGENDSQRGSSLFRDPLAPAFPTDSGRPASSIVRREHSVNSLLLLHNSDGGNNNNINESEPLHFDLTDRESFRSAMKRADAAAAAANNKNNNTDAVATNGEIELSAIRQFSGASGPEGSSRSSSSNASGVSGAAAIEKQKRRFSLTGMPNRLAFSSGGGGAAAAGSDGDNNRHGNSSKISLETSDGGGGSNLDLPSGQFHETRSQQQQQPLSRRNSQLHEVVSNHSNEFVRDMVDSDDDGDAVPAAAAPPEAEVPPEIEIGDDDNDAKEAPAPSFTISPYTFKPRNQQAASFNNNNNNNSSPQQTAGGMKLQQLQQQQPQQAMSEKRREPALFPGGSSFEFPRIADPFASFAGISQRPMHAALSVNPSAPRREEDEARDLEDLSRVSQYSNSNSLHTAGGNGNPLGFSVGSSPSEVQTVSALVKAHAQERKDEHLRREEQQQQQQNCSVTPMAWTRPAFAEQQRSAMRQRVKDDIAAAAAAAASSSPQSDRPSAADKVVMKRTPEKQKQQYQQDYDHTAEGSSTAERILAMRRAGAERLRASDASPKQPAVWSSSPPSAHRIPPPLGVSPSRSMMVELPVVVSPIPQQQHHHLLDQSSIEQQPHHRLLPHQQQQQQQQQSSPSRRAMPPVVSPTYPGALTPLHVGNSSNHHHGVAHDESVEHERSVVLPLPVDEDAELERCIPEQVAVWAVQSAARKARETEQQQLAAQEAEKRRQQAAERAEPVVAHQVQTLPKRPPGFFMPSRGGGARIAPLTRVTEAPAFDTYDEVPGEMQVEAERFVYRDEEEEEDDEQQQHHQQQQQQKQAQKRLEAATSSLSAMVPVSLSDTLLPPEREQQATQQQDDGHDDHDDDETSLGDKAQTAFDAAAKAAALPAAVLIAVAALPAAAALSGAQVASKIMSPVPNTSTTAAVRKAVSFDLGGGAVYEQEQQQQQQHDDGRDSSTAVTPSEVNSHRPAFESDSLFTTPARDIAGSSSADRDDSHQQQQQGQGQPWAREPTLSPLASPLQQQQQQASGPAMPYAREPTLSPNNDDGIPLEQKQHLSPDAVPPAAVPIDQDQQRKSDAAAAAAESPEAQDQEQQQQQQEEESNNDSFADDEEKKDFDLVEPEAVSLTLRECKHSAIITEKLHRLRAEPSYLRPCKQRIVALWRDYVLLYAEDADMDSTPCEEPMRLITSAAAAAATPPPSPSAVGAAAAAAAAASSGGVVSNSSISPPTPTTPIASPTAQQQQQQHQLKPLAILNRDDPETAKRVPSSIKWPLVLGSWSSFPQRPTSTTAVSSPQKSSSTSSAAPVGESTMHHHSAPVVLSFASRAHREQWHEALLAIQNRALRRQRALARQRELIKHERRLEKQQQKQQKQQPGGGGGGDALTSLIQSSLSALLQQQQQQQHQQPSLMSSANTSSSRFPGGTNTSSSRFSGGGGGSGGGGASSGGGGCGGGDDSLGGTLSAENAQALAGAADLAVNVAAETELLTAQQKELAKGIVKMWQGGQQGGGGGAGGGGGRSGGGAAAASSSSSAGQAGDTGLSQQQVEAAKTVLKLWRHK